MSPNPPPPARLAAAEAERLPEEIEKAIEAFDQAAQAWGFEADQGIGETKSVMADHQATRSALTATILTRLTAAEATRDAAVARAERLEGAIRDYLSGEYPNPRNHRPGKCKHGVFYWEECGGCDCEHFEAALASLDPVEET